MSELPKISVITCSYNQGSFIERTIESVLTQDYPNLEHIVVDGMSEDETPSILARYPHLQVIREPDNGQSDAINKGFRRATGEIHCFLNSDDTFTPGTLHRVAREIDPAHGRHVVQGRCRYVREDDSVLPFEHLSRAVGYRRMLQPWNGHCVPQPATFWTAEAWERCGPLDESLHLAMDFDLFCRLRRRYRFHFIDQVFAHYRLHETSKTSSNDADSVTEKAIEISRRYWGSPLLPRYWRLRFSLMLFRWYQSLKENEEEMKAAPEWWRPRLVRWGLYGRMAMSQKVPRFLRKAWDRWSGLTGFREDLAEAGKARPEVEAYRGHTEAYGDGAIGPVFETELSFRPGEDALYLEGTELLHPMPGGTRFRVLVDGKVVHDHKLKPEEWEYRLTVPLPDLEPGSHRVSILSDTFTVLHYHTSPGDFRPLSLLIRELKPVAMETKQQVA